MRKTLRFTVVATIAFSLAYAHAKMPWNGTYASYRGSYLMYSNDLDEKQPPTKIDRKIALMVEGDVAREMFNSMGADLKLACGVTLSVRVRSKGDLECSFDKDDQAAPYTCYFGFDLKTGKSIAGATC